MIRLLILCAVLVGASAHDVMPPDGRVWSRQYQDQQITRLIVKPLSSAIAAADAMDEQTVQAAQAAFVRQAALEATGMEMKVLRRVAIGAVLLELPNSMSAQQAEEYARWIAEQPGIEYAELDRTMWPMLTPNDTFYSGYQGHLKAPADGGPGAANLPAAWDITTGGSDSGTDGLCQHRAGGPPIPCDENRSWFVQLR